MRQWQMDSHFKPHVQLMRADAPSAFAHGAPVGCSRLRWNRHEFSLSMKGLGVPAGMNIALDMLMSPPEVETRHPAFDGLLARGLIKPSGARGLETSGRPPRRDYGEKIRQTIALVVVPVLPADHSAVDEDIVKNGEAHAFCIVVGGVSALVIDDVDTLDFGAHRDRARETLGAACRQHGSGACPLQRVLRCGALGSIGATDEKESHVGVDVEARCARAAVAAVTIVIAELKRRGYRHSLHVFDLRPGRRAVRRRAIL